MQGYDSCVLASEVRLLYFIFQHDTSVCPPLGSTRTGAFASQLVYVVMRFWNTTSTSTSQVQPSRLINGLC